MKRKNNLLVLTLVLLTITLSWSCKESFFDAPAVDGRVDESTAFKKKADFNQALTGVYASLQGSAAAGELWPKVPGFVSQDLVDVSEAQKPLISYMTDGNQEFELFWRELYKMVSSANIVLTNLSTESGVLTSEEKKSYTAQAKFLRGFAYLSLARAFGDVPMPLSSYDPNQNSLGCAPKAEIFAQVIKDISESVADLPEAGAYAPADRGRVSKGAALAYLSYTYMYVNDWAKAKTATDALFALTNPKYNLAVNPHTPFSVQQRNNPEYLAENIFEVQFNNAFLGAQYGTGGILPNTDGSFMSAYTAPRNIGGDYQFEGWNGWGEIIVNKKALDSYQPTDLRRRVMVIGYGEQYAGENMPRTFGTDPSDWAPAPQTNSGFSTKYWLGTYSVDFSNQYLPQMRFAEVLLNYAEILFKLNNPSGAYEYINKVRRRALLLDLPVSSNDNVFMQNLMDERRHELLLEPNLWFHYTRTGTAAKFLLDKHNIIMQPKWNNFPIPAREKSVNPNLCSNGY